MSTTATLLSLLLSANVPGPEMTADAERLTLSGAPAKVSVDVYLARVEVVGAKVKGSSTICPRIEATPGGAVLHCTPRIWAQAAGASLELREFRGVPPLDAADSPPNLGWPLLEMGLAGDCRAPAGELEVGECAFTRGDYAAARTAFTRAAEIPENRYAHLRLGDLAMRDGEQAIAFAHYQHATGPGVIGRMAFERSCALSGLCVTRLEPAADNLTGLPGPLRRELLLRTAARAHFGGRDLEAMQLLAQEIGAPRPACDDGRAICQKLMQAALLGTDDVARGLAMRVFLEGGFRDGPHQLELARAVAVASEKLGAPGFGAGILSSVVEEMEPADVDPALREIVRLYLAAHDTIRANVVLEYADSHAGGRAKGNAWGALRASLKLPARPHAGPTDVRPGLAEQASLANELARSALVRSAAQSRLATAGAQP